MNNTQTPKRHVEYNQDALLCPGCKKRIRLNKSGRLRVHLSGKIGSGKCLYSDWDPDPALSAPPKMYQADNTIDLEIKSSSIPDLTFSDFSK